VIKFFCSERDLTSQEGRESEDDPYRIQLLLFCPLPLNGLTTGVKLLKREEDQAASQPGARLRVYWFSTGRETCRNAQSLMQ
jgi:hypothetical protein